MWCAVTCRKELKQLKSYHYFCTSTAGGGNFTTEKPYVHIQSRELWQLPTPYSGTHIFPRTTRLWIKGTALLFSFWQYHHKCLLHGLAVKDHKILWYLLDFLPLWITICNYIHTFFQEFLSLECKVQLWYFYFCNIITSVVCMALQFLKGQTDVRFISK